MRPESPWPFWSRNKKTVRAPDDSMNAAEKLYADEAEQPASDQTVQKNPQHRIAIIGAVAAIAVLLLGATQITYSYLTASSDTVVNTFAGGAISIKLDEALVDTDGNPVGSTRVIANSYEITPGASYTKDPTITVLAGSEDAYIFIYVDNALPEEYFSLNYSDSWVAVATTGTKTLYVYQSVVTSTDEDITLDPIFTTVTVSTDITSEQIEALGEVQLTIQSYAVQAEGVDQETAIEMAVAFFESEFGFSFDDVDTSIDISGISTNSKEAAGESIEDSSDSTAETDETSTDETTVTTDESTTSDDSSSSDENDLSDTTDSSDSTGTSDSSDTTANDSSEESEALTIQSAQDSSGDSSVEDSEAE